MTIEQAREEIPNFEVLAGFMCKDCTANDWYCNGYCEMLTKAQKIPFERLQKMYAKYDGDLYELSKYIRYTKVLLRGEK